MSEQYDPVLDAISLLKRKQPIERLAIARLLNRTGVSIPLHRQGSWLERQAYREKRHAHCSLYSHLALAVGDPIPVLQRTTLRRPRSFVLGASRGAGAAGSVYVESGLSPRSGPYPNQNARPPSKHRRPAAGRQGSRAQRLRRPSLTTVAA